MIFECGGTARAGLWHPPLPAILVVPCLVPTPTSGHPSLHGHTPVNSPPQLPLRPRGTSAGVAVSSGDGLRKRPTQGPAVGSGILGQSPVSLLGLL